MNTRSTSIRHPGAQPGHFVQFYEKDSFLLESLARFIGNGLREGDAALVLATDAHRLGLEARLRSCGIDLAEAERESRYVALPAAEGLSRFMVDGLPDRGRFVESIGALLTAARGPGRRVRAFGEMVALLWAAGNQAAALRLEELWNEIGRSQPLSLLCGYPLDGLVGTDQAAAFASICAHHARVVPAESYSAIDEPEDRRRAVALLQQRAGSLDKESVWRREAEKSLARRERELRDFVENALEGLHRVGPDGTILWANQAELRMLGYDAKEYVGHHLSEFYVDRSACEEVLARLLRGEDLYDHSARLRCKDGSEKHVLIHSNACWEDGKFLHTRCFTRDVTERERMRAEVERLLASERTAREEAESANRTKDLFLATLSHELRTPLHAILGWSELLRRPGSLGPAEVAQGLEIIERSGRGLAKLIDDVLDVSRIVSSKFRIDARPCDLGAVLRAAVDTLRLSAGEKSIAIEMLGDDVETPVLGDPERLQQVLWNVLHNAVKFTPKGGRIAVLLERDLEPGAGRARIRVKDTGRGIEPEFLPHVFEKFYQAESGSARLHGGLGLGLSIVRHIVELHGGRVGAQSEGPGRGATFTIEIPTRSDLAEAVCAPAAAVPSQNGAPATHELKGLAVLVVDDEPDACRLLERALRSAGATVRSAGSVTEARRMLQSGPDRVLICDIGMPGEDGYALIEQLRRDGRGPQSLPAIALTAFAGAKDERRARAAGFQIHLAKPVDLHEVIGAVAKVWGR